MYSQFLSLCLPVGLRFTRSRYLSLARQMRLRQYWPQARLEAWRLKRLRRLLRHASENVPFYRKRFREAGLNPDRIEKIEDLTCLPPTTKDDILQHFPEEMLSEPTSNPDWRFLGTRGTTNRLIVAHDFLRRDYARAAAYTVLTEDCRYRLGMRQVLIPPDACSVVCGVDGKRETSVFRQILGMAASNKLSEAESWSDLRGLVMNNWIERATILPPFGPEGTHISDVQLGEYIEAIRRIRPTMLCGLPEYLIMLTRYVKRRGESISSIGVVRPMGANLNPPAKVEIESVFGRVREHYGSLELGPIAFDCRYCRGMHILSDLFYLELLRHGKPVGNQDLGTVVVTDLFNFAMPLIRYQIGDVARIDESACECGRNTPRITVEGRLEDTFVTDDHRAITPETVSECLAQDDQIDQFQLLERGRQRWELRIVAKNGHVHRARLEQRCRHLLGENCTIHIRELRSIQPEVSGKFRHCKSRSYENFIRPQTRVVTQQRADAGRYERCTKE